MMHEPAAHRTSIFTFETEPIKKRDCSTEAMTNKGAPSRATNLARELSTRSTC
jgi:hypothetical protein